MSLTYKDTDGDRMLIRSPEDLTTALKEYVDVGKIKIFAQVQERSPASPQGPTARQDLAAALAEGSVRKK